MVSTFDLAHLSDSKISEIENYSNFQYSENCLAFKIFTFRCLQNDSWKRCSNLLINSFQKQNLTKAFAGTNYLDLLLLIDLNPLSFY